MQLNYQKKKRKRRDAQLLTRSETIKQTSSNQLSIINYQVVGIDSQELHSRY